MKKFVAFTFALALSLGVAVAGEGHKHGKSCPVDGKKVTEKKAVEMSGKLLCRHCNLHETESCEKVFQAAGAEKTLTICPSTKVDLEKLSEEGAATVAIKGHLVKCEDGTEMLMIDEAKKVS